MEQAAHRQRERDVPCAALQVVQEKVENLERWQANQNGHLRSIDEKIDKLIMWLLAAVAGAGISAALLVANLLSKHTP